MSHNLGFTRMAFCQLSVLCVFSLTLIVFAGGSVAPALAQSPDGTVGGISPILPVVPRTGPRKAEGNRQGEKWQTERDDAPVAQFIDSLKGTDAAIEVIVGQGRLLTTKKDIASEEGTAVIAVGDPTIVDFEVLPNPRMIRLVGLRAGVTDLSITVAGGDTYAFEVHVVYDLDLLRAQLRQVFPDALLRLAQLREHVVVEGQARKLAQVNDIMQTIRAYLDSVQVSRQVKGSNAPAVDGAPGGQPAPGQNKGQPNQDGQPARGPQATGESGGRPQTSATMVRPQIINLIRVPGVQQVLLKVRIAELNRSGLREIGSDMLYADDDGNVIGTNIIKAGLGALGIGGGAVGNSATAFGIFPSSDFSIILRALRRNNLATILAEPNLITLSGHKAHFLAGGEFPIPVPQSAGGLSNNTTIQFREFGVRLNFVPYVKDEETIRLSVEPEVSSIDASLSTTLVTGGDPVPGLITRRASTTVELRQGQTLAIAGLLQVELAGNTARIPGLGDLPYIGPFFSNTSHSRVEKELLVLVTPYLVEPLEEKQVGPLPGQHIMDPNDQEFYFMNRIQGRTGRPFRSTTDYEHSCRKQMMQYHDCYIHGPVGFSK